jgi:tRNA threonylcarbamoyladenosine biosynthesis protein TsaE
MGADARTRRFESRSEEATRALGAALGALVEAGDVLALDGDLGAGKTAFVRGLAHGLGIAGPVQSPTYTLVQSYADGRLALQHLDAYMDGRERAFLVDGGAEWLSDAGVVAVEWAERVAALLPPVRLAVRLAHRSPEVRAIELAVLGEGPRAEHLARVLAALRAGPELVEAGAAGPAGAGEAG